MMTKNCCSGACVSSSIRPNDSDVSRSSFTTNLKTSSRLDLSTAIGSCPSSKPTRLTFNQLLLWWLDTVNVSNIHFSLLPTKFLQPLNLALHNIISLQPHRRTQSSSVVMLSYPPTISSLTIKRSLI